MHYTANYWIKELGLTAHIEGGAFKEIYRSALVLPQSKLTSAHGGNRNVLTVIHYLLQYGDFSALHRIASDEIWHFYDGAPLSIYELTPAGEMIRHQLGKNINDGESLVVVIPAGSWFGCRVEIEGGFTLCGCSVAPGFDFADFELADRGSLVSQFPDHKALITALTR